MRIVIDLQSVQTESRYRGIGRYATSFTRALAKIGHQHELIVLANGYGPNAIDDIHDALSGTVQRERIRVFHAASPVAEASPANAWRARAAETMREAFIVGLQPDAVIVTSLFEGFVDEASTSVGMYFSGVTTAVVLHDLIPLLHPDIYLSDPLSKSWYHRKIASIRNADLLLANSESSRHEAIRHLNLPAEKVVTISSAIDPEFHPVELEGDGIRALLGKFTISKSFIMYAGAADGRKNIDRLIAAYALLPNEVRQDHQLVFAGKMPPGDVIRLRNQGRTLGIADDRIVFTGYIADSELVALYSLCSLFVLPSLHEGFGLPALEAMACGAPVIGANATSIPEVIGFDDALFDPMDTTAIAGKMTRVITDSEFHGQLRQHGLQQAKRFSWEDTARRALAAVESICTSRKSRTLEWAVATKQLQHHRGVLLRSVAGLKQIPVSPTDDDLLASAAAIEDTLQVADSIARSRELPNRITWRIEGPFDSSYSLALLNRETARALAEMGHQVVLHSTEGPGDFTPSPRFLAKNPDIAQWHDSSRHLHPAAADVTSRNLYPPRVADMVGRFNLLHHYAWEESGFPTDWVGAFNDHLQGVTCLSEHVMKIMIDNGVTVPLSVSGCGVDHWERVKPEAPPPIPGRKFRFLHVSSCFPRKGPEFLLQSYGRAFTVTDDVVLIIKTFPNPHNHIHQWLKTAQANHPNFPEVHVIEEDLSEGQLKALYQQCDALVAPSMAEGFGLPMAEAMLSGLAVITTGWGGQLDFCTQDTSWLVDYRFAMAKTHFDLFDSVWAEPDVDHLTRTLEEVVKTSKEERLLRTNRGRKLLLDKFRWRNVADRLVASARAWSQFQIKPEMRIGWVTTYHQKCGIATYSDHLLEWMPRDVTVLAPIVGEMTETDGPDVRRCWEAGEHDTLEELSSEIEKNKLNTLVIQFNYGFFQFERFASFLDRQISAGRTVVLVMHATSDPEHAPHKILANLAPVLQRCDRLLVHSVADLNRLKALGLVSNVALFPHGILDYPSHSSSVTRSSQREYLIASYGFFLPHKGLPELIEAVAQLRSRGHFVRFRMVNAEYPVGESRILIEDCKSLIIRLGLQNSIEMVTDYLTDAESFKLLSDADLIVFPYQHTAESASGAVRYGLATGRPVAVTPLAIFDDVSMAVHRLPGHGPDKIASGIQDLLDQISASSPSVNETSKHAARWRDAHRYSNLTTRLDGILRALVQQRINQGSDTGRLSH